MLAGIRMRVCACGGVCACVGTRVMNSLKHAFFFGFNEFEIYYANAFGVVDYESKLKI